MILPTCRLAVAAILVCLAATLPLAAQDPTPPTAPKSEAVFTTSDPTPTPAPSPSTTFDASPGLDALGKLFVYFTIIAALGAIVVYISRHGFPFRPATGSQDRKLQILEMRPLGNKQFLVVVGYEGTRMLLGVTPGKIDYLCPLDAAAPDEHSFGAIMANQNSTAR